jgi:hypothetical protein
MDRFLHRPGKKDRSPGPLIVFEPVQIRSGVAWRAFALAKVALMVWGGVSLAGVGAGAVVYARSGSIPTLQAPAVQAPSRPETKLAVAQPQPQAAPVRKAEPARSGTQVIQVKPATSAKTVSKTSRGAARELAKTVAPIQAPAVPAQVVRPEQLELEPTPLAQARLPQSRPTEPEFTGSIERSAEEAAPPRRFRRLRDARLRTPYAPGTRLRMPPPVDHHIRQVWSSFPMHAPHQEPWRDVPRYR